MSYRKFILDQVRANSEGSSGRLLDATEACKPFVAFVALHLFAFFGTVIDSVEDRAMALCAKGLLINRLEKGEVCEMGFHPVMEIFDVCNGIDDTARTEDVGVFCEKGWGDDACLVLPGLEMGIREEEEEGREGVLLEKIGEEFHGVGTDNGDVVVMGRRVEAILSRVLGCMGDTEGSNAVADILGDLDADLKAEDADVGIMWCKIDEETAKAAPDVSPLRGRVCGWG